MPGVALLVAGMHRSGTSALTRVLVALGCDAPKTLMAADAHNAKGYWESAEVAALNDDILASAGSSWDSWEPFNQDWYASPVAETFRARAQGILEQEFGASPLFVLKDPRICRMTRFWLDALEAFGATTHVILPFRHPLEVAASLAKRDAIDQTTGLLMWLRNVLDAEADSRRHPRAFPHYQDLLANWQGTAAKVGAELGIAWPRQSASVALEVSDDLSSALRHHRVDEALGGDIVPWVAKTHAVLRRWADDGVQESDFEQLDAVRTSLTEAAPAFAVALAGGVRASQRNRELEREIGELNKIVTARDEHIESVTQAVRDRDRIIAGKDRQIAELDQAVADRDVSLNAQLHVVAARDGQIGTLLETVAVRDRAIAERDGIVAERDQRLAALEGVRLDLEQQIRVLFASTSWRVTAPMRRAKTTAAKILRSPRLSIRLPDAEKTKLIRFAGLRKTGLRRRLLRLMAAGAQRLWRLVPLRWRTRLLAIMPYSMAAPLRTALLANVRSFGGVTRVYVPSGRIDLADLNSEAFRNQAPVPILFDADYYLANNAEAVAGRDPLQHYLERGATDGLLPIDIDPDEIDPDVLELHRFDLQRAPSPTFDASFYRALHPDLSGLDDEALADHYRRHGQAEGRAGSKPEFLRRMCQSPCEIPIDFHAAEYIELYPDLEHYADKHPLAALGHYMRSGRWEPRLHTLRSDNKPASKAAVDLGLPELGQQTRPLCVLAHVYYPDLWEELAGYLANLPPDAYDLYVNLVDTTFSAGLLAKVRADFPHARVYISRNAGRDIGGHMRVLRNVRMTDYRFFCLVHTKKSPHMSPGEVQLWRRRLLMPLMGDPDIAAANIKLMLADDKLGLLGAERCRYRALNDNPDKYFDLLGRLGIEEGEQEVEFLSGTMMFVRREVLQRLLDETPDIDFEPGDDQSTDFHRDGQWAHAVERAFGALVRHMGYRFEWR